MNICNPTGVRPNSDHGPNQRAEDEQNIQRGEVIIFQTELNRGENEIENEIENERQGDQQGDFFVKGEPENRAKGNGDEDIEKSPDRPKEP